MKRLLALLAGFLGIRALLRRRPQPVSTPDPADDLRAKLAETRTPPPEPPVEDRRADVHARARAAMDELRDSGE